LVFDTVATALLSAWQRQTVQGFLGVRVRRATPLWTDKGGQDRTLAGRRGTEPLTAQPSGQREVVAERGAVVGGGGVVRQRRSRGGVVHAELHVGARLSHGHHALTHHARVLRLARLPPPAAAPRAIKTLTLMMGCAGLSTSSEDRGSADTLVGCCVKGSVRCGAAAQKQAVGTLYMHLHRLRGSCGFQEARVRGEGRVLRT